MAHETGKTVARGRPGGVRGDRLRHVGGGRARGSSTTCAPTASPPTRSASSSSPAPWNFPTAIPANGVVAALAAGNAVILKPAPEAVRHGGRARRATSTRPASRRRRAVRALPGRRRRPAPRHPPRRRRASCSPARTTPPRCSSTGVPTSGCSPRRAARTPSSSPQTADVDLALRDLVRSAFGHAGQKCSAASLAIVEASVYDDPRVPPPPGGRRAQPARRRGDRTWRRWSARDPAGREGHWPAA